MNKTVNINIGGLFFHIDEDAYQKLSKYFDSIKRSLSNSSGQEEIMKDIEMRVAELLTEKQKSEKHVVNNKDVEEVIAVMGQPEDYRIDDDAKETYTEPMYYNNKSKKLYRDKDRGLIGGVCTGLGHYFGIEAVWIKIIFLLLAFTSFGIIAYIILWIAIPKAVTTSEKLEMTGEPVTISNIEKKVREEFDNVSNKIKNTDYTQVKTGAERVASGLGDVLVRIFGVFAKVIGALILMFSGFAIAGLFIALLTLGSTSFIDTPWVQYANSVNYTDIPLWMFGLLTFFTIGIPLFFFLLLGLKLLVNNLKPFSKVLKYSLLGLWILSFSIIVVLGIQQSTQIAYEGKVVAKETINLNTNDTLKIKFVNNEFYKKNDYYNNDFEFTQDSLKNEVIYSNNVRFFIKQTDKNIAYLQVEKLSNGKSYREANERAEKIKYGFKLSGNQLLLDNYWISEIKSKYRGQRIELYLYLPKGTLFKVDKSVQDFDESDNEYFNLHYSSDNYTYRVDTDEIKCLDCPPSEDEYNDVEISGEIQTQDVSEDNINDSTKVVTVKINGKETTVDKKSKKSTLTISPDGTITKTTK